MLEFRGYTNLDNALDSQNDEDMLRSLQDYGCGYISDIVMKVADNFVGIYYGDLLDEIKNLYYNGAWEEAIANGLMEGETDLMRQIQIAWYEYNTMQLYNEIETGLYNWATNYIRENGIEIDEDRIEDLMEELEDLNNHCDTFEDIVDVILEYQAKTED